MKIGQMINFIDASAFPVSPFKKVLRGDTGRRSRQTMLNLGGSDRREHNPREVMPAEPGAGLVEVEYRQQNIRPTSPRPLLEVVCQSAGSAAPHAAVKHNLTATPPLYKQL